VPRIALSKTSAIPPLSPTVNPFSWTSSSNPNDFLLEGVKVTDILVASPVSEWQPLTSLPPALLRFAGTRLVRALTPIDPVHAKPADHASVEPLPGSGDLNTVPSLDLSDALVTARPNDPP